MKKRLFSLVLSLILIFSCFSLVGCSGGSELIFNGATFNSTDAIDPPASYTEKLTYSVNAQKDYNGNYGLGNISIDEKVFWCEYSNGSYISTLTVYGDVGNIPFTEEQADVKEFIKNSQLLVKNDGRRIYHLRTEFSIDVNYKINNGENKQNHDTIVSDVYFCSASLSYAPIYSETHSVNTMFTVYENESAVGVRDLKNVVKYYLDEYTSSTTVDGQANSVTCDYEFQTVTDNAQLLFVMRNCDISDGGAFNFPVVAFSYDEPVTLTFRNNSETEASYNFDNYNGEATEDAFTVKNLSFLVANTSAPGAYQYAVVQKTAGKEQKVNNNALLTTYAHMLYSYGSVGYYQVLVYNLTGVEIYSPSI